MIDEDNLARRDRPWLAQLLLGALLLVTALLSRLLAHDVSDGVRVHHLSVLGYVMPDSVLRNVAVYDGASLVFAICGLLWWIRVAIPITPVLTVAALGLLASWRVEHELYIRHNLNAPFAFLVVLAGWAVVDRRAIRKAEAANAYASTELMPRWVPLLCLAWLGWGYTMSGMEKLYASGLAWGDGSSLRIWLVSMGTPGHPLVEFFANHPKVAAFGQMTTLFAELFALPGLLHPRTRLLFGVTLVAFHLSLEWALRFGFYGNEVGLLVLAVIWPVSEWWAGRKAA